MRRVVTMIAGLIGFAILVVLAYGLLLNWANENMHASTTIFYENDAQNVPHSNPLVSVPAGNSNDTMLVLPDTHYMGGAKASLDALSGPHLLGQGQSARAWPGCSASVSRKCPAWVLHADDAAEGAPRAAGAYRFAEDYPTSTEVAWIIGLICTILVGWVVIWPFHMAQPLSQR